MISAQTAEQPDGLAFFFQQYGLLIVLAALLIFMFWSSRRRMQKQKTEQAERARQTVPGAEVLLQGGLYGTIISYDPDNLDQPAVVELAPGVEIKVHSQAILRVVDPVEPDEADDASLDDVTGSAPRIESIEETAERLADDTQTDAEPDAGTKPQA